MDASQFDTLARSLMSPRTRRAVAALVGAALAAPRLGRDDADAKKKKKKRRKKPKKKTCAQTCSGGCCTSEFGACILPAQQNSGQCGTGGAICRNTGCFGVCPDCPCSASSPCPDGQCCAGDGTCGACRVFLSSSTHTGNLGGLAGADAICQGLAGAAGLPGSYMAWLSDETEAPSTRFIRATAPYIRVDGAVIANSYAELTDGSNLDVAINLTEQGMGGAIAPSQVWTCTGEDGQQQLAPEHCNDWTKSTTAFNGSIGNKNSTGETWTGDGLQFQTCDKLSRLYCFQQR